MNRLLILSSHRPQQVEENSARFPFSVAPQLRTHHRHIVIVSLRTQKEEEEEES